MGICQQEEKKNKKTKDEEIKQKEDQIETKPEIKKDELPKIPESKNETEKDDNDEKKEELNQQSEKIEVDFNQ